MDIDREMKDSGGADEDNLGKMPIFSEANDMDCKPFVDDSGLSDDNSAADNERIDPKK